MEGYTVDAPFIDNAAAPEFFASGLHEVEVMGPVCRFVLYAERQKSDGSKFREPVFTFVMPAEAVPHGIALTLKRLTAGSLIPAVGAAMKAMMSRASH